MDHVPGGGVHAEAGQRLREPPGIVPQLRPGLHHVAAGVLVQKRDGRELIDILLRRLALLDLLGDGGRGVLHLCGRVLPLLFGGGLCRDGRGRGRLGGRCGRRGRRRDCRSWGALPLGGALLRQDLVRGLLALGLGAEEAAEDALFLLRTLRDGGRGLSCGLGCRRFVVQGEVDLDLLLRPAAGLGLDGRQPDALALRGLAALPGGALLLRLLLILGPAAVFLDDGPQGQPQGNHQQHHQDGGEEDQGRHPGEDRHRSHRQRPGEDAAGCHGKAAAPKDLQDAHAGGELQLAGHHVGQGPGEKGDQHGAGDPQPHGLPVVAEEDQGGAQHGRGHEVIPIAEEPLHQHGEPVDEDGLHPEVADGQAQRQKAQHTAPDLPPDGLLLRLGALAPAGAGGRAGGAGAPGLGTAGTAFFLRRCHGGTSRYVISARAQRVNFRISVSRPTAQQ